MSKKSRVFAFDFDGVISQYDGFISAEHTGEPILAVVDAIRKLKENGHEILIHSSRGDELLRDYCSKNDIPFDYINKNPNLEGENPGKPIASVYVDDRAVRYLGQTSEQLVEELESFKTHWQK
ncbi:MAG: hydroxymethylpyrimidine pyrophosphatase-like HAD family hydrolase [Candidatus Azotimanducaceae bacterium]|jgi:hydroxymethylpyrimidine pyrophosphatase-like HAD family hydrolase